MTVKVDKTAPVTTATVGPARAPTAGYAARADDHAGGADVTRGSGVASTQYAIDGGEWQTYTAPFVAPVGEHTIRFRSTDNAGLVETDKELAIKVRTNSTEVPVVIGGEVPGVLALDAHHPGQPRLVHAGCREGLLASTTSAKVTSSAGDATLIGGRPELDRTRASWSTARSRWRQPLQINGSPLAGSAEHPEDLDRSGHR